MLGFQVAKEGIRTYTYSTMAKYDIDQLIELRETAHVPTSVDFAEFTRAILEQRERQLAYV